LCRRAGFANYTEFRIALSAAITMALVREGSEGELKLDVADSDSD